ncbi:WD40 repeat-like protein [Gonapodya prolifera JEL478]|uniref:WD40 repeat-like protein n=1 Tax=Gonapodya prolifera (strain JEL478) TaxID=1344416 RepID=A0A139A759_GONPJ|nr:WD40 repeat-like protein [Gonapodya prolifera JEL478]|eukprot:KXS12621.1 WD40 repeat-like protein [Gonapodya prolifera JEL478]
MNPPLKRQRLDSGDAVVTGVGSQADADLLCPICIDTLKEAYMTRCGHSFCHACIVRHLELPRQECPVCSTPLKADQIFPNFTLTKILSRPNIPNTSSSALPANSHATDRRSLDALLTSLLDQKRKLDTVERERDLIAAEEFLEGMKLRKEEQKNLLARQLRVLETDLVSVRAQLSTLGSELDRPDVDDPSQVSSQLSAQHEADGVVVAGLDDIGPSSRRRKRRGDPEPLDQDTLDAASVPGAPQNLGSDVPDAADPVTTITHRPLPPISPSTPARLTSRQRRSLRDHTDDLEEAYEEGRLNFQDSPPASSAAAPDPLYTFRGILSHCLRYSHVRTIARLHYADGIAATTNSIVSAIEFDRDDEYFATAGVTKKIKIFEFSSVVADYSALFAGRSDADTSLDNPKHRRRGTTPFMKRRQGSSVATVASAVAAASEDGGRRRKSKVGKKGKKYSMAERPFDDDEISDDEEEEDEVGDGVPRYPVREMSGRSKISCVSWNSYIKSHLASSDYEGVVTLWDAATGQAVSLFNEHEKRTWSVDFSRMDPMMIASGSDDAKVKIWSTNQPRSVCTIEAKANVCSVRFNPEVNHQIAFGSADHFIHYFDIRNPSQPIHSFRGHKKAVSYVKFAGKDDFLTASTDATLRLWSIPETLRTGTSSVTRTYTGHINEKNFVGLSVNSETELFACGSESNEVFIYHRSLARPLLVHRFGAPLVSTTGEPAPEEDGSHFVSSVCWRRHNASQLICANSCGRLKVVEIV